MRSRPRNVLIAGLVTLSLLQSSTLAQLPIPAGPSPAVPGVPGAVATPVAQAAAPAAMGAPRTLWSFLGLSKANLATCRDGWCRKPFGQMMNNGLTTLGAMSGGMIHPLCPPVPSAEDVAALSAQGGPLGSEAVAAKVKQDEAAAKGRVAAVEYLGTVDCRYWSEAKVALLNSLRADRSECVRYAAACALANGCCCSKETIEALRIVVAGEDSDGFPAEFSPRVKATSFVALQNCLLKNPDALPAVVPEPAPPLPAVRPEAARTITHGPDGASLVAAASPLPRLTHAESLKRKPMARVVAEARSVVNAKAHEPPPPGAMLTGERSLADAIFKAHHDSTNQARRGSTGRFGLDGANPISSSGTGTIVPAAPHTPPVNNVENAAEANRSAPAARITGMSRTRQYSLSQLLPWIRSQDETR